MPEKESLRRAEEFESLYANNVRFESSVWDLRILFGLLDQSTPAEPQIEQHTAISLAWPEVKITAYLLLVHMVAHQAENGLIHLPASVIPQRPNPSDPTVTEVAAKKAVEYMAWIHDQFFGANPYVPPGVAAIDEQSGEKP